MLAFVILHVLLPKGGLRENVYYKQFSPSMFKVLDSDVWSHRAVSFQCHHSLELPLLAICTGLNFACAPLCLVAVLPLTDAGTELLMNVFLDEAQTPRERHLEVGGSSCLFGVPSSSPSGSASAHHCGSSRLKVSDCWNVCSKIGSGDRCIDNPFRRSPICYLHGAFTRPCTEVMCRWHRDAR